MLLFQNCQQAPVDFLGDSSLGKFDEPSLGEVINSTAEFKVDVAGEDAPPLKMIFVVDNSFTMEASQVDLSKAFKNIFAGENGNVLTKFDTELFLFSTAQKNFTSLSEVNNIAPFMPDFAYETISGWTQSQLSKNRTAISLSGKIPGDILGYSVLSPQAGFRSYHPAPVLGIEPVLTPSPQSMGGAENFKVSRGVRKLRGQTTDAMAAQFSQRLSLMSPRLNDGVFNRQIDQESGLCAIARVLRHSSEFIRPGELASFVVISDENDQDPTGASCIDSDRSLTVPLETASVTCSGKTNVVSLNYTKPGSPSYCKYSGITSVGSRIISGYSKSVQVSYYVNSTSCKNRDGVTYDCVTTQTKAPLTVYSAVSGNTDCDYYSGLVTGSNVIRNNVNFPMTCNFLGDAPVYTGIQFRQKICRD